MSSVTKKLSFMESYLSPSLVQNRMIGDEVSKADIKFTGYATDIDNNQIIRDITDNK
jgi:hypothetical protein